MDTTARSPEHSRDMHGVKSGPVDTIPPSPERSRDVHGVKSSEGSVGDSSAPVSFTG